MDDVQDKIGFVFDLDLRGEYVYSGEYTSRLGVEQTFYAAPVYGSIFSKSYHLSRRQIFENLAAPKKYPM